MTHTLTPPLRVTTEHVDGTTHTVLTLTDVAAAHIARQVITADTTGILLPGHRDRLAQLLTETELPLTPAQADTVGRALTDPGVWASEHRSWAGGQSGGVALEGRWGFGE